MPKNLKLRDGSSWLNLTPIYGVGFPNGVVSASVGSIYIDTAVTNGASSWIKKSGTGNTGWVVEYGTDEWTYFNASNTVELDGSVYKLTIPFPQGVALYKFRIDGSNSSGSVGADFSIYTVDSGGTKIGWNRNGQLINTTSSTLEAVSSTYILSETLTTYAKYSISFEHSREFNQQWGAGIFEGLSGQNYRTGRLSGNSGSNPISLVVESSTLAGLNGLRVSIYRLNNIPTGLI
jgi:hypothetical protein